jgi:heme exporter protein B
MSGVLGLGKSYVQEMETGCMGGLLTTPVDRSVLFLGKMLANTIFLVLSQLLFIPLCLFLFEIEVRNWNELILVLIFGTVGFSSLGTLLSAMTATVRGKEMLLPILIFPLMVPSLLCVVRLTDFLFFGSHPEEVWSWWKLLLSFDVVLFTVSLLGFEFVVEE